MAKKRKKSKKSASVATAPPAGTTAGTKTKSGGKASWKVMDRGSTVVAGLLAQRASTLAWRAVVGRKPPTNGRHPEVSTGEALAWAAIGGALVELVKVGVRRRTSNYWVKSTGHLPPGMKPLTTSVGTAQEPAPKEPAPTNTSTKKKLSRRSRGR